MDLSGLKDELEALDGLTMSEHHPQHSRTQQTHSKLKPHKPHKKGSVLMWIGIRPKHLKLCKLTSNMSWTKALTLEQIRHFHSETVSSLSWTALDVLTPASN